MNHKLHNNLALAIFHVTTLKFNSNLSFSGCHYETSNLVPYKQCAIARLDMMKNKTNPCYVFV